MKNNQKENMKINDFDLSKRKNRTRINAIRKKCEMPIGLFPRSSSFEDIVICCELLSKGESITPERIKKSGEKSVENLFHTMKLFRILDNDLNPQDSLYVISNKNDENLKLKELSMIASRSTWVREWKKWENISNTSDMGNICSKKFLQSVSYGREATISQRSSNMNSLMRQIIKNHPSKDTKLFPDTIPWGQLKRYEYNTESIFEPDKLISAIQRVSKNADFVRVGTGYLSIYGYDLVARNLHNSQVRLLVGSDDTRGRMVISNAVSDLKGSLEHGPASKNKYDYAQKMRLELVGGGLRVRSLKARHTPDFHSKIQIYDKSAVISGSANLSCNGLIKNVENAEIIVDESKIKYYLENFDNYFREGISIEDELIEMLDDSWAICSDELISPKIAFLRILLEMYGDSEDIEKINDISLDDYQEYSVNKSIRDLQEFGGALLVSPTGTGKTMMGSMIARRLTQMKKVKRVFFITPNKQILQQWRRECLKLQIPFDGMTFSHFKEGTKDWKDTLSSLKNSLSKDDLVVIDECHHIRNKRKGFTNMLETIGNPGSDTAYRLLLTATPMSRDLDELNNLLEITHGYAKVRKPKDVAVAPSITYLTHSLIAEEFAKESSTGHRYVEFSGEARYFAIKNTKQVRYESTMLDEMIGLLESISFKTKVSIDDGQHTIDGTSGDREGPSQELYRVGLSRYIESSPKMGIYGVNRLLEQDLESLFFHAKTMREKLRLIKIILENMANHDSKLQACIKHIRDDVNNGRPVLIFAEYVFTVEYLKYKLQEEFDVVIATVTGDDNEKVRKATCERFSHKYHKLKSRKNDPKILIATDSLSEGVDLPDAETMVNYDLFWTPLKIIQRVGRLDRPTLEKRSFRAINMMPSTDVYDNLFNLVSRLDSRSGIYRKMSGIEIFRENTRDLDNLSDDKEFVKGMYGDEADLVFSRYLDQFATKVLGYLAKATDSEKEQARALRNGTISNCDSENNVGVLSVVKDRDGYPHLLSEFYDKEWGVDKINPDDQESATELGYPGFDSNAIKVPDSFYDRHELMLSKLAVKYGCEITDLVPIINLIKS